MVFGPLRAVSGLRNVFYSIDFLLQYSAVVREKVKSGEVDVQGGVYDLETGASQ